MRRFSGSVAVATTTLLLLALPHVSAEDVVGPWNKLVRDAVKQHKVGTSDSSRILASLHLAQFQAVNDLLATQQKTATDVDKDPQLRKEVLAAVAGAGKAVLEKATLSNQRQQQQQPGFDNIFAGPVRIGREREKRREFRRQGRLNRGEE